MSLAPEIFAVLVNTLADRFKGRQCSRVEAGNGWLAMSFRPGNGCLFVSWNDPYAGVCTASENDISRLKRTEPRPFPFGDVLQKHITRFNLIDIERVACDRIISLRFSRLIGAGIDTSRTLVAELTGRRSNLHLIRDDGSIMESARPSRKDDDSFNTYRPGRKYSPPPQFMGVDPIHHCDPGIFFSLDRLSGFSSNLGSKIKENWHLFPHQTWVDYFRGMTGYFIVGSKSGPFLQSVNSLLSAFPIPIGNSRVLEDNILELLRSHVILPLLNDRIRSTKQDILKKLERKSLKLVSIRKGIENQINQSERAPEYKEIGKLLLANATHVHRGSDSVTLPQWRENGFIDTVIKLDPSISVSQNAQIFFRKYKKFNVQRSEIDKKMEKLSAEETTIRTLIEIIQTTEDLDTLAEISDEISSVTRAGDQRSTHGPVKIFEFAYNKIIAGTNSKSNRKVTFVFATGEDLWFHAKGVPGGHVIVRNKPGLEREGSVIGFAASLAAHFSKYAGAEKVDVDYTRRKHVRPVPGTCAKVIYSHARTITVSPLLWEKLLSENRQVQGEDETGSA